MRFCTRIAFLAPSVAPVAPSVAPVAPAVAPAAPVAPSAPAGFAGGVASVAPAVAPSSLPRLRARWPFLNEPSAPVELKALVTQRITRYHEYTSLYAQLRDCQTVDECADVAGRLLDAYIDGRLIAAELDYYQKHRRVLGRHPYFRHFQQLARLRSSNVKELLREQQKTKDNIWRVNSEIRKGNKPHLDTRRRQKLQEYQLKLQEINRLLGE